MATNARTRASFKAFPEPVSSGWATKLDQVGPGKRQNVVDSIGDDNGYEKQFVKAEHAQAGVDKILTVVKYRINQGTLFRLC